MAVEGRATEERDKSAETHSHRGNCLLDFPLPAAYRRPRGRLGRRRALPGDIAGMEHPPTKLDAAPIACRGAVGESREWAVARAWLRRELSR